MHIAMLSKSDVSGGGASRVAADLSALIRLQGGQVTNFARTENVDYIDLQGQGLRKKLYRKSARLSHSIGLPDILTTELFNITKYLKSVDAFHIHDISSAISPLTIKALSYFAPVVWTLHDCSPFTGGCIYPLSCNKFINRKCSACPQLHEWPLSTSIDFTGTMQSLKLNLINKRIKKIICPSEWIANNAIAAGIKEDLITVIYNSTDTNVFTPKDKPTNKNLCILLSSVDLNNKFKGSEFALRIINELSIQVEILLIGKNSNAIKSKINNAHSVTEIDQTFDKTILAEHYRNADILLHTSTADNCPLTIIEAMSSGVPVVTYNIGGIPELVTHNVNGWIGEKGEVDSIVRIIEKLHYDRKILNNWKIHSRKHAELKFNSSIFLDKHLEIYEGVLHGKNT